jgi:hypothetical protein
MLLSLLLAATPLIGYTISSQVPEELAIGKKWFFTASVLISVATLWFAPWWIAVPAILGMFIGWFPGMFGLLLLILASMDWTLACLAATLGILLGTRWRTEKRSLRQLIYGSIALAVLALLIPQFI